jgi:hypothetical protein
MVQCKEVIICNILSRGAGIFPSPTRNIIQVFDKDGKLIAENDPFSLNVDDLLIFCEQNNIPREKAMDYFKT